VNTSYINNTVSAVTLSVRFLVAFIWSIVLFRSSTATNRRVFRK